MYSSLKIDRKPAIEWNEADSLLATLVVSIKINTWVERRMRDEYGSDFSLVTG